MGAAAAPGALKTRYSHIFRVTSRTNLDFILVQFRSILVVMLVSDLSITCAHEDVNSCQQVSRWIDQRPLRCISVSLGAGFGSAACAGLKI